MYEVIELFSGYSVEVENGMRANSSSIFLKGSENIIVDTLTSWDGEKLLKKLKEHGMESEDIAYVICSHGHSDHIGCNYLFKEAIHIVGFDISKGDLYTYHDFKGGDPFIINEFIKVIPTPGHTMQDVTVLVQCSDKGLVAVTGDLFEKEQDLKDDQIWKSAGSGNQDLQMKNRNKILELADWIIPGHGPMFRVPSSYKAK